jgi:hypothetical protein
LDFENFWPFFGQILALTLSEGSKNIPHSKEFSGNQGNHQNFDPSILPYKFGLIFKGMKQKKCFFFEKKIQNGRLKKNEIFKIANFQNFITLLSLASKSYHFAQFGNFLRLFEESVFIFQFLNDKIHNYV